MKKIITIVITLICFSCKTEKAKENKIEKDIVLEKYTDAIEECEKILFAGPEEYSQSTRNFAADYLCLALLKTGELNNKYYGYKEYIKELIYPIPSDETIAGLYLAFETGKPVQKDEFELRFLYDESYKKSVVFWNVFEKNSIVTNRTRYYELIKNNIDPNIPLCANVDADKTLREWNKKTKSFPNETKIAITGNFFDDITELFYKNPNNKETLEVYTAMMLFTGNLDSLPQIAKRYKDLGYARLPDYVQEAAIIISQNPNIQHYQGFEIENGIRNKYIGFLQAINSAYMSNTYMGASSPLRKFSDMFSYHFYIKQ